MDDSHKKIWEIMTAMDARDDHIDKHMVSCLMTTVFEWDKWRQEIPYLNFPAGYEVKIVPPFAGAVVRFCIRKKGFLEEISVYLDGYNLLGLCRGPYWEAYPVEDDTFRCSIDETEELITTVTQELERVCAK